MVLEISLNIVRIEVTFEQSLQRMLEFITQFLLSSVLTTRRCHDLEKLMALLRHMVWASWTCNGTASFCFNSKRLKWPLSEVCHSHVREKENKWWNHKMLLTVILLLMTCVTYIHFSVAKAYHQVKSNSNGAEVFIPQGASGSI